MTQTTDTLIERLEMLLAAGSGYPWAYRPQEYDDWGFIRCAPDNEGREWVAALARSGAVHADEAALDAHRRNRTDPYEPHGRLIVEAVNALPTLLSALRSTAKEVDRLREALEPLAAFADWWERSCLTDDYVVGGCRAGDGSDREVRLTLGHARAARAALTPADPAAKDQA